MGWKWWRVFHGRTTADSFWLTVFPTLVDTYVVSSERNTGQQNFMKHRQMLTEMVFLSPTFQVLVWREDFFNYFLKTISLSNEIFGHMYHSECRHNVMETYQSRCSTNTSWVTVNTYLGLIHNKHHARYPTHVPSSQYFYQLYAILFILEARKLRPHKD